MLELIITPRLKKDLILILALMDNMCVNFFLEWFNDALKMSKNEANACVFSTVSSDYKPSSRIVLLKYFSEKGFTFFTNYKSDKSFDIDNNNNVALIFYWPELERQVRISGSVKKIGSKKSDDYFKSRPRESQLSAWLSDQSTPIDMNYNFSNSLEFLENKFKDKPVSRPLNWGGYCVIPNKIEFWQGRPSRFHDRVLYVRDKGNWNKKY